MCLAYSKKWDSNSNRELCLLGLADQRQRPETQGKISDQRPATQSDAGSQAQPGHLSNHCQDICLDRDFKIICWIQYKVNTFISKYIHIDLRLMFSVKLWRNPIITVMVMVRVQYCGTNDGFWIQRATQHFFSNLRPCRGRHVLAPRDLVDPSDPATLPTLIIAGAARSATRDCGG